MVRVPVAPQVQPQVQQEQVAAPQFQAAPSPGMQSAMQLGQDLMQAGKMAIELQRDKQAMEFWKAREERREQIAQGREAEAAAKEAERLKAKTTDFIVDEAINLLGSQVGEVADIFGRTTGRESVERFEEANSAIQSLAQDLRDKLQDEDQIALFDMKVGQRIGVAQRNIRAHYSKQLDLAQKAARIGNLETLGREAATSSDTQDFVKAAAAAEAVINQMNTLPSGVVNQDVAKQQIQAWYGQYVGIAADRMIRNNDHAMAHTMVSKLSEGGRLEVSVADKMLSVIANAEEAHSSREVAKNLVREGRTGGLTQFESTTPDPESKPLPRAADGKPDYNAIIDVIDSADRPDSWKEQAKSVVEGLERDQVRADQRAYNTLLEQARSIAYSDEAYNLGASLYNEIEERVPGLLAKLEPEDREALKVLPREDDPLIVMQLETGIANGDIPPEQAVDLIIRNRGRMTPQTADYLTKLATPGSQEIIELRSWDDFFKASVSQFAPKLFGNDDENKARLAVLKVNVRKSLANEQARLQRKLTDEELQTKINSVVTAEISTKARESVPAAARPFSERYLVRQGVYIDGERRFNISDRQGKAVGIIAKNKGVDARTLSAREISTIYQDIVSGRVDLDPIVAELLMLENIDPNTASKSVIDTVLKDLRMKR